MKFSHAALLSSAILFVAPSFAAAGTADIAKVWTGVVAPGMDTPVILTIKSAQPGGDAGTIKWGQPYTCTSQLVFVNQTDGAWVFTTQKGVGTFCVSMNGGKVYLRPARSKTDLQYRLNAANGAPKQETVLSSAP